jgi:hypothetical protein
MSHRGRLLTTFSVFTLAGLLGVGCSDSSPRDRNYGTDAESGFEPTDARREGSAEAGELEDDAAAAGMGGQAGGGAAGASGGTTGAAGADAGDGDADSDGGGN